MSADTALVAVQLLFDVVIVLWIRSLTNESNDLKMQCNTSMQLLVKQSHRIAELEVALINLKPGRGVYDLLTGELRGRDGEIIKDPDKDDDS